MLTSEDLTQPYLPSGELWKGFAPPMSCGPNGAYYQGHSGNPAFGFFDNFHTFHDTSLEGPYLKLATATGSIAQFADTATEKGLVNLAIVGDTEDDETVLQWGSGLGAPFKLADKDLVFEARLSLSQITAAKYSFAVGLGEVGMGATTELFVNATQILADNNFLGFVSLNAEAGVIDGAYKADGQAYQDGSTKTKLNALHTAVAGAYVKLGFRYRAHPKKVEFYVDNALPGLHITPARLTTVELDAATFPDDVFMAPIIGAKDAAGDTALSTKLDWWACAQML